MERLITSEAACALRGEGLLLVLAAAVAAAAALCVLIGWKAHAYVAEARGRLRQPDPAARPLSLQDHFQNGPERSALRSPPGWPLEVPEDEDVELADTLVRALPQLMHEDARTSRGNDLNRASDEAATAAHSTEDWLEQTRATTTVYPPALIPSLEAAE